MVDYTISRGGEKDELHRRLPRGVFRSAPSRGSPAGWEFLEDSRRSVDHRHSHPLGGMAGRASTINSSPRSGSFWTEDNVPTLLRRASEIREGNCESNLAPLPPFSEFINNL